MPNRNSQFVAKKSLYLPNRYGTKKDNLEQIEDVLAQSLLESSFTSEGRIPLC